MSMFENNRKLDHGADGGGGGGQDDFMSKGFRDDRSEGSSDSGGSGDAAGARREKKELTALEKFIREHSIHSPEPGVISVSLNGLSREEFVERANKFAAGRLVVSTHLRELGKNREFTAHGTIGTTICIDGHVEGSQRLSIGERKNQGMADVSMADAVTAHVAFNILNLSKKGEAADLFCGYLVQASDGYLQFGSQGVGIHKMGLLIPDSWSAPARERRIAGMKAIS